MMGFPLIWKITFSIFRYYKLHKTVKSKITNNVFNRLSKSPPPFFVSFSSNTTSFLFLSYLKWFLGICNALDLQCNISHRLTYTRKSARRLLQSSILMQGECQRFNLITWSFNFQRTWVQSFDQDLGLGVMSTNSELKSFTG